MSLAFWTVTHTIKGLTRMMCRVEDSPLARVPSKGPLILVCNHINFMDVPLVFSHLQPRSVTGFAKSETWENPFLGALFNIWGAIPIQRGEADLTALRAGLKALEQGKIVAITPEGTRSGHGQLQQGHPGVIYLALRSGAPLLPLVYYGQEALKGNLLRLRRTDFHINIGQPFYLKPPEETLTRAVRQAMTNEIMYQLAALLPQEYRGVYGNSSALTTKYLRFCNSSEQLQLIETS